MKRTDLGTEESAVAYHIVTMIVFSFELSNVKKETNLDLKKVWQGIMFCMFSQSTFRNRQTWESDQSVLFS